MATIPTVSPSTPMSSTLHWNPVANRLNGADAFGETLWENISTPATPSSGNVKYYAKGSSVYMLDSSGNEHLIITNDQTQTLTNKSLTTPTIFTQISLTDAVETWRNLFFETSGVYRWALTVNNVAETGSNAGSNFTIGNYDDAGASLGAVMAITRSSGAVNFPGTVSKGGGSFLIDHPLDPENKDLVHAWIEGPRADNLYRGQVALVAGSATVDIDIASNMTPGTFAALNRDPQAWLQNDTGWAALKGSVVGGTLTIECQDGTSTDTISWMVVAERNDVFWKACDMTDANGDLIVERDKEIIPQEEMDRLMADKVSPDINILTTEVVHEVVGKKGYPRHWKEHGVILPTRNVIPD